ncbi:MAG TPA: hypothetical protein P5032_10265 [Candidatus Competibacter sp.]|nr:hypothetical protein [Candidatus Competibacter sp.]
MSTKQVAFTLHTEDHDRLKRLSASMDRTYSQTVALALRRLEESNQPDASGDASDGLAYAQLHPDQRRAWRSKMRQLRASGLSFGEISRQLYRDHGLCGLDRLPLNPSSIRSACAL